MKAPRFGKLRFRMATLLDRLPGQCWADLVTWALGWHKGEKHTPWSPQDDTCRLDVAQNGCCWCGKLTADQAEVQR